MDLSAKHELSVHNPTCLLNDLYHGVMLGSHKVFVQWLALITIYVGVCMSSRSTQSCMSSRIQCAYLYECTGLHVLMNVGVHVLMNALTCRLWESAFPLLKNCPCFNLRKNLMFHELVKQAGEKVHCEESYLTFMFVWEEVKDVLTWGTSPSVQLKHGI